MITALDLITSAMQKIGAVTKKDVPSADEAHDALAALNHLLESWSNEAGSVYARTLESFLLSAHQGEYIIGPGGDFDTVRPIKIIKAYVRIGRVDYDLEEVMDEDFARIAFKSIAGIPEFINYDHNFATGRVKIYPLPSQAYHLFVLSEKPLKTISSLNEGISLPPGWERALIYHLAVDLAPEYGQRVTAELAQSASESKRDIMRAVRRNKTLDVPRNIDATRNIFAGWG